MLCVFEEESRYALREPGRTCRGELFEVVCMLKLECDSERLWIANDIGLVLRKKKDLRQNIARILVGWMLGNTTQPYRAVWRSNCVARKSWDVFML